jgi:uncharacterized protein (DUF952 family)
MTSIIMVAFLSVASMPAQQNAAKEEIVQEQTPQYLYKVLSVENWEASQSALTLQLSKDDDAFIHFSTDDQLERITSKYWAKDPEHIILKIDTSKFKGKLVYEANPGGASKYYHLYEGSIPLEAIIESKTVKN